MVKGEGLDGLRKGLLAVDLAHDDLAGGEEGQSSMGTVSAQGSTVWILMRLRNSSFRRSMALVVLANFHTSGGRPVKANSRSPASSRLSATARHSRRHLLRNALRRVAISASVSSSCRRGSGARCLSRRGCGRTIANEARPASGQLLVQHIQHQVRQQEREWAALRGPLVRRSDQSVDQHTPASLRDLDSQHRLRLVGAELCSNLVDEG
jgi:hypothetical protein